jgi:hypothetical protein
MKKVGVITIVVIAALLIAVSLLRSSVTDDAAPNYAIPSQVSTPAISESEQRGRPPRVSKAHPSSSSGAFEGANPAQVLARYALAPGERLEQRAAALTEREAHELCSAEYAVRTQREKAARAAEQKDPAWAYSMEQKLREHIARQPEATQFEIVEIECKTTFCELEARVLTDDSSAAFDNVLQGIAMESLQDPKGFEIAALGDEYPRINYARVTWNLRAKARNAEQGADRLEQDASALCEAALMLRGQRETKERAAEPKDSSWAYPMEQLLKQYVAEKLRRQPVENLAVDCRTTYCTITASGHTPESREAFRTAATDASREPWSDLWAKGSGGSAVGEAWSEEVSLQRR